VVEALRNAGVEVEIIGTYGDLCDLLCKRGKTYYLLDVTGITKNRKRDPDQLKKFALWGVIQVKDEAEALRAVGL
jgi:hypothetical protein